VEGGKVRALGSCALTFGTCRNKNASMAKTCPITTVQDSIDALALSLFEALRGIRDATVASSSSLTATKMDPTLSAYRGEEEEEEEDEQRQLVLRQQISSLLEKNNASVEDGSATGGDDSCSSGDNIDNEATRLATIRLLHGLNVNYFPPRAYDMNNPDYESFLIAYLSEDKYAKELVEMMQHSSAISSSNTTTKQDEEVSSSSSSSSSNNTIIKLTSTATATTDGDNDNGNNMMNSSAATTTKKSKLSIKLNVSSKQRQLLPKHIIQSTSTSTSGGGSGSSSSNSSGGGGGNVIFPRNHEEYVRLLHSARHDEDECTARRLAQNVLSKSRTIDALVSNLPGMERNRSDQLRKIGELISLNHELSHELEEAYTLANARREEVRRTLRENTCLALGIEEEEEEEE